MRVFVFLLIFLSSLSANSGTNIKSNSLKNNEICNELSDRELLNKNPGQYFFKIALLCNYKDINNQVTFDKTINLLKKAAQYKYSPAYLLMGVLYENKYESGSLIYNAKGSPQDLAEAIKNLEIAAAMGSALAQNKLGELYLDDAHLLDKNKKIKDVSNTNSIIQLPDMNKAIFWFKLAAKNGNPAAQGSLSELYKMGIGVPQDFVKAYAWQNISIVSQFKYNKKITANTMGQSLLNSHLKTRDSLYKNLPDNQKSDAHNLSEIYVKKFIKKPSDLDLFCTNYISYISAINIKKILG